jgi:hypothetical protein
MEIKPFISIRKLFMSRIALFITCLALASCTSQPSISELKQGTTKVAFVQNGMKPLGYSTGVIDTPSFWSQHGQSVSLAAAAVGSVVDGNRVDKNALMVEKLYGSSQMAEKITAAVLPAFAQAWHVSYDPTKVIRLTDTVARVDLSSGYLTNVDSDADMLLVAQVDNINLTERFSMGGALLSGVTMGMNEKMLTTEVRVGLQVFKRDPNWDTYKQVWATSCDPQYIHMETAYPLTELAASRKKMDEVLAEATRQSIERCTASLNALAKNN